MRRHRTPLSVFLFGIVVSPGAWATAPTVVLTYPPANVIISEALTPQVLLQASVTNPDDSIDAVGFYVCLSDGAACIGLEPDVGDTFAPPYQVRWTPTASLPSGGTVSYLAWAKAFNSHGQMGQSIKVPFTVVQIPSLSVTLVAPNRESGYVTPTAPVLYATASPGNTSPPSSIASVEFLDGDSVVGIVMSPNSFPDGYAFSWQGAPPGVHLIAARASDTLGNSRISSTVTVYIIEPDPPPLVALSTPVTGQLFAPPSTVPLAATASSTLGTIQRIEFATGSTIIGTVFSPPYVTSWVNPPPGNFAVVATAFDDIGVATSSPAAYVQVLPVARLPSVVLTAPAPGTVVASGTSLALAATALAPDGAIGRVDFYAGATLAGSAASAPYQFTWANPTAGAQSLTARAYDLQANVGTSTPLVITVIDNRSPTVAITSPTKGAQFIAPATIALAASASDSDGTVAKVDFFADATKVATATIAPYSANWLNVGAGSYVLTAVATDNLGATTKSASANVTVTAMPPTINLAAPSDGATYVPGQNIVITADANAPQRSISRVEFYSDTRLIGTAPVTGGPSAININLTWTGAGVGAHVLAAKVLTNDGASATSPNVNIRVSDLAVDLTEPHSGQVYQSPGDVRISANPTEVGGVIAQMNFYGDGVLLGTVTTAPYVFLWNSVAIGPHSVSAQVRNAAGLTASSAQVGVTVVAAPTLQVDTGIDGSTVGDDSVSIGGTVQAPSNSAVVINGQSAALDPQGRFFANAVQLTPGTNTVMLTLNTLDGMPIVKTINLNSNGIAPFRVDLEKSAGLAPFTTNLIITNRGNVAFQRIEIDLNDDGTPEQALTSLTEGKSVRTVTYPNPGIYTLRVTVYDASNTVIYIARRKLRVYSLAELGLKVVNVYRGMVDRLAANNPTAALRYFTGDSRPRYQGIFDTLGSALPNVALKLQTLIDGFATEDTTELTILQDSTSGPEAMMIYLIRGGDGIWRIENM